MKTSFRRNLPLFITAGILVLLFSTASLIYPGFCSPNVVVNLLADNAFLGISAVGMTLVIFAGGIDLSVGAVIGFTSIFAATLIEQHHFHPAAAALVCLALGALLGLVMGTLIHAFKLPAFLITLAGMFLARGGAYHITTESVGIQHPLYTRLSGMELSLGESFHLPLASLILLAIVFVGYLIAHHTRLGRTLLAVGGSESSALLMGLPVGFAKISAYTINSTCAALAGLVATLYTGSGNPSLGVGLELDAIAVVVIGGTLLSGGRGHMIGTLIGLLIFGTIQSALLFDGRLNSWWVRIVVGVLLLGFILLQRTLVKRTERK